MLQPAGEACSLKHGAACSLSCIWHCFLSIACMALSLGKPGPQPCGGLPGAQGHTGQRLKALLVETWSVGFWGGSRTGEDPGCWEVRMSLLLHGRQRVGPSPEELGLEASQPLYLPTLRQFRTALPELPLATSVLQVTQTPARQQVGLGLGAGGHCAC